MTCINTQLRPTEIHEAYDSVVNTQDKEGLDYQQLKKITISVLEKIQTKIIKYVKEFHSVHVWNTYRI